MLPVRGTSFGAILMAANRTKTVTLGSLLNLIVNGVLSLLFISFMGPVGAAWATTLSVIALGLFYSIVIGRHLEFGRKTILPWRAIVQLFLAVAPPSLIVIAVSPILPKDDMLRLVCGSVLFFSILATCYDRLGILKFANVVHRIKSRLPKR